MHHGNLLKELITKKGAPVKEFAEKLGMSRQNLYLYYAQDRFTDDFIKDLEKAGIAKAKELFRSEVPSLEKANKKREGIPYLGELDIFAGKTDIAHADLSEYITEFISIPGFRDANYFVNVRGSSMYPKYVPGEIIAIKLCKVHKVSPNYMILGIGSEFMDKETQTLEKRIEAIERKLKIK